MVASGGTLVSGRFRRAGRDRARDGAPFKLYAPGSRDEVVTAVREVRTLGQRLLVRGPGDRDEEVEPHGVVLSLERLDRIVALDPAARTVSVEPGVLMQQLEDFLAAHGFGLAVAADEPMRCVGSFARLLGVGSSSHRAGLFVDQLRAIEQVAPDGQVCRCRDDEALVRLAQDARAVTTRLTLSVVPEDKRRAVVACDTRYYHSAGGFLAGSSAHMRTARPARLQSARFVDVMLGRDALALGVTRAWQDAVARPAAEPRALSRVREQLRARLGARLPELAGLIGLVSAPQLSAGEAERASWQTIGDARLARVHRLLLPQDRYETAFWALYETALSERRETGALRSIAFDVRAVRSPALRREHDADFCELRMTVGLSSPERAEHALAPIVAQLDALCRAYGARRLLLRPVQLVPTRR